MNKVEKVKINDIEAEELACKITGLDYDEIDADLGTIEDELINQFGCDFNQFCGIIRRLLPLIDVGSSPLTKKTYKGFSDTKKGIWLIKTEVSLKK